MDEDQDYLFEGEPDLVVMEEQQGMEHTVKINEGNGGGEELIKTLKIGLPSQTDPTTPDDPFSSATKAYAPTSLPFMRKLTGQAPSSTLSSPSTNATQESAHDAFIRKSNNAQGQDSAMLDVEELSTHRQTSPISPTPLTRRPRASPLSPLEPAFRSARRMNPAGPTNINTQKQTFSSTHIDNNLYLNSTPSSFSHSQMYFGAVNPSVLSGGHGYGRASSIASSAGGGTLPVSFSGNAGDDISLGLASVVTAQSGFKSFVGISQLSGSLSIDLDPATIALLADLPDLGITREKVQDKCRATKFNPFAPSAIEEKFIEQYIPTMKNRMLKLRRAMFNQDLATPHGARHMIEAVETELYRRCYNELQAIIPKPLKVSNDNTRKRPAQWHQLNFLTRTLLYIDSTVRNTPQSDIHIWHACCWLKAMQWQFDIHDAWTDAIVNHGKRKNTRTGEAAEKGHQRQRSTSAQLEARSATRRPGRPPGSLNKTTIARNAAKDQKQVSQLFQPQNSTPVYQKLALPPQQPLPGFDRHLVPLRASPQAAYQPAPNHNFNTNNATHSNGNQTYHGYQSTQQQLPKTQSFVMPTLLELELNPRYDSSHGRVPHVQQLSGPATTSVRRIMFDMAQLDEPDQPDEFNGNFTDYLNNGNPYK